MTEKNEDLSLPNSIVMRLLKDSIPDGVNVSKDARTAITRSAVVFVSYITACANSFAMKANRKTLSAADVFEAVQELEFYNFTEPLQKTLEAHQEKKETVKSRKDKNTPGKHDLTSSQ